MLSKLKKYLEKKLVVAAGMDAFFHDIGQGNDKNVQYFLEEKIDVNFINRSGITPLHRSLHSLSPKIVLMLLEYGANPNIEIEQGKSRYLDNLKGKPIQFYLLPYFHNFLAGFSEEEKASRTELFYSYIRILVMFGTTRDGLEFDPGNPEAERIFNETEQLYRQKLSAEQKIKTGIKSNILARYEILQCLWDKLGKTETQPEFKSFYQRQSLYYNNLIGKTCANQNHETKHSPSHLAPDSPISTLRKRNVADNDYILLEQTASSSCSSP